jgi:hypothetical protein
VARIVYQTTELESGDEWVVSPGATEYHQCCECNLLHKVTFWVRDGKVVMRWRLDPEGTKRMRRRKRG